MKNLLTGGALIVTCLTFTAALQADQVIMRNGDRVSGTIGYVNSQLGNTEKARAALTTASEIGSDESIRQSAKTMLENLP